MQITMPLATFRENFIKYIPELVNSQLPWPKGQGL
jgi:hypothetical protein